MYKTISTVSSQYEHFILGKLNLNFLKKIHSHFQSTEINIGLISLLLEQSIFCLAAHTK